MTKSISIVSPIFMVDVHLNGKALFKWHKSISVCECGMESLISSISQNNDKSRPLSLDQLHNEITIKKNGPHPLHKSTDKFLLDALCKHFGGGPHKWTFSRGVSNQHSSAVISRHINSAPEPKLL